MIHSQRYFRILSLGLTACTCVIFLSLKAVAFQRESIHFESIMGNEELHNLSINTIYQDQYGLIWVGTDDGLVCYTGNSSKAYKYSSTNSHSVSSKRIFTIGEDNHGDLWVSTYDGLNKFNRKEDNFTRYPLDDKRGNSLTPDGHGMAFDLQDRVLIGSNEGLAIFDPKTETWDQSYSRKGEFLKHIHSLGEDKFLLAALSGFHQVDLKAGTIEPLKDSPKNQSGGLIPGRSIFKDSKGQLWLGTIGRGCFVFDSNGNPLNYPIQDTDTKLSDLGTIRFFIEDFEGNLWIGSNQNGLLVLPNNESHILQFDFSFRDSRSVPAERLQTAAQINDDQLLLGTENSGVIRFDPHRQNFEFYTRDPPIRENLLVSPVRFIATGPDGYVWLNDSTKKLSRFDPDTRTVKSWTATEGALKKLRDNIFSMAIDKHNRMFVSTEATGLYVIDLNTKELEPLQFESIGFKADHLSLKSELYFDSHGMLWIAGKYILRYNANDRTITAIGHPTKARNNNFTARTIHENENGDLWFGSVGKGLYYYSREQDKITEFYEPQLNYELLKDTKVTGIYQQHEDYLWVTTQSGIGRLNLSTNEFDNPDYIQPILATPIFGLQCDGEGTLWVVTARGLTRINIVTERLQRYSEYDGLFAADFTEKPLQRVRDDMIILGGQNGMNVFNPKNIGLRPQPPKVTILDITIRSPIGPDYPFTLDQPPYMAKALTLPCSNNSFTINFASISPGNMENLEYAYKLEGLETNWNYVENVSRATFTTVREGEYTFKVKARNQGLSWSDKDTSLKIIVLAPYYLKTWFHVSMGILVLVFFYAFVRYRTYRINLVNKRLARQVFKRTKDLVESRNEAIDARKAAEQADKAKSTFLATVSHEIRTPMNGVLGMSKLLHKTKLDTDQKVYIEAINKSGSSLLNIINDILDYSKMEAGKFRIHCHEVNLREDLESIVSLFMPEAKSRNIEIITEVDGRIPKKISADGHRLRQVITNLLNNAIKFTKVGSIKITASTAPPRKMVNLQSLDAHVDSAACVGVCDLRLYFSITDTGIGIDPKDQKKLFESFSQVEQLEDRAYGGTGIGLAISKKLVNLMGGEIMVESTKGAGSTFAFSIFSRDLDNEPSTTDSCCEESIKSQTETFDDNLHEARILVTDDNEINRIVAEGLIKSLGYQVESSNSGKDTLERLKNQDFDLILMDIQMPEIDGLETTRIIRKELSKARQPIIVAMTADSRDEMDKTCSSSGMHSVLQKPITEEKLLELFQHYGLIALQK